MRIQIMLRISAIMMLWAGLNGCDNSSSDSKITVARTGITNAGRRFEVISETRPGTGYYTDTLRIDGEKEIALYTAENAFAPRYPQYETMTVSELAGTPALLHIYWASQGYNLHDYTDYYNYIVVPIGHADTILIKGEQLSSEYIATATGAGYLHKGEYRIEYQGNALSIIEHWKHCGRSEIKETERSRNYELLGTDMMTLNRCIERSRSIPDASDCSIDFDLTPLPVEWQAAFTPADMVHKCVTINPSL